MKYIKSIVSNSIHFKELENSVLFILDDGFKFFHPLSMTHFICNNIEITYTDEWKFTLRKSEKGRINMLAKLLKSFDQIGEPMCSLTKSAKITAMVLVYGGNHESFTYSTKLKVYLRYIMDKYHIGGGGSVRSRFRKRA